MSRPLVVVHWRDAEGCGEQENIDDVLRGSVGCERDDVGYLILANEQVVIIAGTDFTHDDKSIDRRLTIPRAYVMGDLKYLTTRREKKARTAGDAETHKTGGTECNS